MTMQSDMKKSEEWILECFQSDAMKLDYTIESLKCIDIFFERNSKDGRALPGSPLNNSLGGIIFSLGCYVGSTILKHRQGKWNIDENNEIDIEIELTDGTKLWPVKRVMKRFKLGSEENIYHYGMVAIGRDKNMPTNENNRKLTTLKDEKKWYEFWK